MNKKRDVFLCHSSEDKDKYVIPFTKKLKNKGVTFWIDEAEIKWGDNIIEKINEGIEKSNFVIVFLLTYR